MKTVFKTAHARLFQEHDPAGTVVLLTSELAHRNKMTPDWERALHELLGLALVKTRRYDEASQVFEQVGNHYQAGYSQMLQGNLMQATQFWQSLLEIRQNHWCLTLYGMVNNTLNSMPTFLQIRNHLEADIMNLIEANQYGLVENLTQYLDYLGELNYETFKYAGRAFYHRKCYEKVLPLLLQGQRILPQDPEVYFHLGQYYAATDQPQESRVMLQQCLLTNPYYYPAKVLLQTLDATSSAA